MSEPDIIGIPRSTLQALLDRWKESAVFEWEEMSNQERSTTLDQCADELAAILAAAPEQESA